MALVLLIAERVLEAIVILNLIAAAVLIGCAIVNRSPVIGLGIRQNPSFRPKKQGPAPDLSGGM
jgi:hypothetical protein